MPYYNCLPSGYCYRGLNGRGLPIFNVIVICFLVGIPVLFLIGLVIACFCCPAAVWGPGGYRGWNERRKNRNNPIDFRVGELAVGSFPPVQTEQVIVSEPRAQNVRTSEVREARQPMIEPEKEV